MSQKQLLIFAVAVNWYHPDDTIGEEDAWADMVKAVEQIEALTKAPQAEE